MSECLFVRLSDFQTDYTPASFKEAGLFFRPHPPTLLNRSIKNPPRLKSVILSDCPTL
jgi:hypothetical protein